VRHPAYPRYKPSGVEWLGDVPVHWEVKRLRYLALRADEKVEADAEMPLPYVGMEHIESWTGRLRALDPALVPEGISNRFRSGDTLFGKLRPYLAKACNVDFEGLCSSELLVLRAAGQDRRFLLYRLLADGFIALVNQSTYGAKMPRASWDVIGSCIAPSPPADDQCAIADFLDRETRQIDRLVATKRTLIDRLKEKRTALISRTVTRGLPPDAASAVGFDPHPTLKPSGFDWIGDVPEHWEVLEVRRVALRIKTGSTPPTSEERYYDDGTVPWFGPSSFDDEVVVSKPVKWLHGSAVSEGTARLFRVEATMVVTIGATLGKVSALSEMGSCNQQITVIEFNEQRVHARFGTYQLKRLEGVLRAIAPSATLPILGQDDVASITLALPSLAEQRTIADFLDQETARIDLMVAKVEAAIERLQEYRSALITAAVTGKVDVRGR
jgi:type I restriction enzyme S subunit